jgi:hypothetical protein
MSKNTIANGQGQCALQYRDGQTIPLSLGWSLYLCLNDGGDFPYLQGFVHAPKNRCSASLAAARDLGATTGDYEIEIPAKVMRELADPEFDQFD